MNTNFLINHTQHCSNDHESCLDKQSNCSQSDNAELSRTASGYNNYDKHYQEKLLTSRQKNLALTREVIVAAPQMMRETLLRLKLQVSFNKHST